MVQPTVKSDVMLTMWFPHPFHYYITLLEMLIRIRRVSGAGEASTLFHSRDPY